MSKNETHVGIDVSQKELVVFIEDCGLHIFTNCKRGLSGLIQQLSTLKVAMIVLEACNFDKLAHKLLGRAGFAVHVAQPRRVRAFATYRGFDAKTDAIDAEVLMNYAKSTELRETPVPSDEFEEYRELVIRREQLKAMRTQEKNRKQKGKQTTTYDRMVSALNEELDIIEQRIKTLQPTLSSEEQRVLEISSSVVGVGDVTSSIICVDLPEIGKLPHAEISKLAGVAPMNNDSGTKRGRRKTCPGRARVTSALYMAAVASVRHNPSMRSFYQRLKERGKASKVALIAVARKLVTLINALVRDDRLWTPEPPKRLS